MKNVQKNSIALVVIVAAVGVLWFNNRTVTPGDVSWADVEREARAGEYRLVTTDEVWQRFTDPSGGPLLVDTRQEWEFRTGHIEGAKNFPMEPTWLSRWQNRSALEAFLGPDRDNPVIFY